MNLESQFTIIKQIKHPEASLTLWDNGIIYVYYHDYTVLDVELQLKMADSFNEITNKKRSLFIFDAGEGVTITKEARDNALKLEDSTPILATAVIAPNLAYRIIANFFLKVQKPKGQYQVVSDIDSAIEWFKKINLFS